MQKRQRAICFENSFVMGNRLQMRIRSRFKTLSGERETGHKAVGVNEYFEPIYDAISCQLRGF
jgi:hypothetical protein